MSHSVTLSRTMSLPLRFAPTSQGSFSLLELPPDLAAALDGPTPPQLSIRGRPTDDAVLCTPDRTYALRAVTLSNTFLVTSPGQDPDTHLAVHDEVAQILELVPAVPRLERLPALLQGCEYEEGHEEDADSDNDSSDDDAPPRKRARFTRHAVRGEIQASDAELAHGLQAHHILDIDGHLRPLPPAYLTRILEALLTALVAEGHPLPPRAAPAPALAAHLAAEHAVPQRVVLQVLPWFGALTPTGAWTLDVRAAVRQVGIGRLIAQDAPLPAFLAAWRAAVGDTFADTVDLALLEGTALLTPPPPAPPTHISPFPAAALPTAPTARFAALFRARARWRAADLVPFLEASGKERDVLLMKYARATVVGAEGEVWYTARATVA